jgi:hypothetical protein
MSLFLLIEAERQKLDYNFSVAVAAHLMKKRILTISKIASETESDDVFDKAKTKTNFCQSCKSATHRILISNESPSGWIC